MQAYLNAQGDTLNRVLRADDKLEVSFEKTRYQPDVKVTFTPQERPKSGEGQPLIPAKPRDLPSRRLELKPDERLWLTFAEAREPGVYSFELTPLKGGDPDVLAVSYNVDAETESNLARTATEKLESKDKLVKLRTADDDFADVKNHEPDLSERPWLYLVLLIILIAEQAMAVHLSFHLKGSEGTAPEAAPAVKKAAA
jgi:hypothetical protein